MPTAPYGGLFEVALALFNVAPEAKQLTLLCLGQESLPWEIKRSSTNREQLRFRVDVIKLKIVPTLAADTLITQ